MSMISPLAFVNPEAKIGKNVTIDAFVFIDKDVVIGDDCHIRPHTSIISGTRIGNNNDIHDGCVIGADPQDFRWKGEKTFCVIGDNNSIHEHVIINRSIRAGEATRIGSNSFIMAQTHVGHDSEVGDWCVLGNAVKIAGDCKICNYSILSSGVIVHERCEIGEWTLIKGGCRVNSHVPPFVIMAHNPIEYFGVNAYVLRKGNKSDETINDIAQCYRHIYQSRTSVLNALQRIENDVSDSPERKEVLDFVRNHNMKIAALPLYLEED